MKNIRQRLSEKAAKFKIPMMSAFELLPVCNLSCKMCYVRKPMSEVRAAGGLKDVQWWLDLSRQARDCGLLYPLLTGGEPFLYPGFFDLLSGMSRMGLQVSINSNGTLIKREVAAHLQKDRPVRINLTLYGGSEDTYERLCGDGDAYRRVLQSLEHLREYNIPVKFNASITPDNVQDLDKMITIAKDYGSPIQVATYMFPPVRRDSSMVGTNARLSPEEAAHARVHSDYLQNDPHWFVTQADRFSRFVPLGQIPMDNVGEEKMGMTCRAGRCSFWVDWQGKLVNCGMYGSAAVELSGKSFRQAWEELSEMTSQVRYAPYCVRCPNRSLCHPCIAVVSNETGSIDGRPEYMCRMNQALSEYYIRYAREYYPEIRPGMILPEQDEDLCEI